MSRELRRRLREVDPDLKIIPGGNRHRSQWDKAAGEVCSRCRREYFRGRDGMCYACWEREKDTEVEIRDQRGVLNFFPRSILEQITHPARKEKPS